MPAWECKSSGSCPNDRDYWHKEGERLEVEFVSRCKARGIEAIINPKKKHDKYAPDLIVFGNLADLKCQFQPFFTAYLKYRKNPQWSVTFNRKDYERYGELYPDIDIYFWVWFEEQYRFGVKVLPVRGVWHSPFSRICSMVDDGVPEHVYHTRGGEGDVNAKSSFILNLKDMEKIA